MTSLVKRRVVPSFSRELEFATETELSKRMRWSLSDNALDACEEAEVETPSIPISANGNALTVGLDEYDWPPLPLSEVG
jgi:hypothetical protein